VLCAGGGGEGGIFLEGEREGGIEGFGREEGNERVVSMGWREEKSVWRGRVVGKVGGERNQAGSQPGSTRLDSTGLETPYNFQEWKVQCGTRPGGKCLGMISVGRKERKEWEDWKVEWEKTKGGGGD